MRVLQYIQCFSNVWPRFAYSANCRITYRALAREKCISVFTFALSCQHDSWNTLIKFGRTVSEHPVRVSVRFCAHAYVYTSCQIRWPAYRTRTVHDRQNEHDRAIHDINHPSALHSANSVVSSSEACMWTDLRHELLLCSRGTYRTDPIVHHEYFAWSRFPRRR